VSQSIALLCTRSLLKLRYRYRLPHSNRFSQCLDAFEFVHRLCREV